MSYSRCAGATSEGKSDMFVTSLDIFSRPSCADPHRTHISVDAPPALATSVQGPLGKPHVSFVCPTVRKLDSCEDPVALDKSSVCKLKRFSSLSAFTAANSVLDFLQENLGAAVLPVDEVNREVLQQRRRSFFDSLFTVEEHARTALPCRFSTNDIDNLFRSTAEKGVSSTESYRNRLAALHQLRSTLDC
ncbi:hypothetical protein LSCM1_03092 [Leishmania martiniquensis]|uniref:Uncharacterized protein n=1 Tax=Leishmania martiniquensis TaxID=1580590 RepID=A0A836G3C3_9TRYP|nr:hypothetical protein LSCM1_03092 [Leishmania martiniquensis]